MKCPECGDDTYVRGVDVGDYCHSCKTMFIPNGDEWSISDL